MTNDYMYKVVPVKLEYTSTGLGGIENMKNKFLNRFYKILMLELSGHW